MMAARLTSRRWQWVAGFAAAAIIALAAGIHFGRDSATVDIQGRDAAALLAISLPNTKGQEQSLGQWKGKVLVVNFWATWCVPCREEMPQFVKAQRDLGDRGLQIVGIAIDQPDKVDTFAGEIGLNYPTLIGGFGAMELSKTLGNGIGALPFTVIVDRSGRVIHTQLGPLKDATMRSIVGQLL